MRVLQRRTFETWRCRKRLPWYTQKDLQPRLLEDADFGLNAPPRVHTLERSGHAAIRLPHSLQSTAAPTASTIRAHSLLLSIRSISRQMFLLHRRRDAFQARNSIRGFVVSTSSKSIGTAIPVIGTGFSKQQNLQISDAFADAFMLAVDNPASSGHLTAHAMSVAVSAAVKINKYTLVAERPKSKTSNSSRHVYGRISSRKDRRVHYRL
jgi:hypothetical protein